MLKEILLIALVVYVAECCAPTNSNTATTTPHSSTLSGSGRKRRSAQQVIVTVVTTKDYHGEDDKETLQNVVTALSEYAKSDELTIKLTEYDMKIAKNNFGKFAVEYSIQENCDTAIEYFEGAKKSSKLFDHIIVNCEDESVVTVV